MRVSEFIPVLVLAIALFLLVIPFFDSSITGLHSFDIMASPCMDLDDSTTWKGNITDFGNRSYLILDNMTLCTNTYRRNSTFELFIFNGSFVLDCNGSTIVNELGLGKAVLSIHNNSKVQNCIFQNFMTGANVVNIQDSTVPYTVFNWTQNPSGNNDPGGRKIIVDKEGYLVFAGYDKVPNEERWRVVKMDKDGTVLWNWTQNASGDSDRIQALAVDQDNNYIVGGYDNSPGNQEWRVVKLDSDGNVLWNFTQNPSGANDAIWSIAVDQEGNYVVAGYDKAPGEDQWRVIKLDSNGNLLWNFTQNATGGSDVAHSVIADQENNYVVAGYDVTGNGQWRVVKLNSDGNVLWNWTQDPSVNGEYAQAVIADQNNDYVIAGFDQIPGNWDREWRVVKIDKNGNTLWNWTTNPGIGAFTLDTLLDVSVDQDNNYLFTGADDSSGNDGWGVTKLDVNSNTLWNWSQNPSANSDISYSIAIDLDGNYFVAGYDSVLGGGNGEWRMVKLSPPKKVMTGVVFENVSFFNTNSTGFVGLNNASATLTNFTIGYNSTVGKITYSSLTDINGSIFTNWNIFLRPDFVSLNSSKTDAFLFNVTADIVLETNTTGCFVDLYKAKGLYTTRAGIINSGSVVYPSVKSCLGSIATFTTVNSFSGYASRFVYDGCVNLSNVSTFTSSIFNKMFNVSNDNNSFIINDNITLCRDTYENRAIHDFFIFNGSYILNCNSSTIRNYINLGSSVLSIHNNSKVQNCIFNNFATGLNVVDIQSNVMPITEWNWTQNPQAGGGEPIVAIEVDQEGYYVFFGEEDPGKQFWRMVKLNKDSNVLWNWSQNITNNDDEEQDLAIDQDNNYVVCGQQNDNEQIRVVKVSSQGVTLWNFTQDPSVGDDSAYSVAVDKDNNYIVGGSDRTPGVEQFRVIKLDSNGNVIWNYTQNPSVNHDRIKAVAVDQENNYILAGFDRVEGAADTSWRVVKITSDGTTVWNWTQNPSAGDDQIAGLAVDQDGNYVVAGYDASPGGADFQFRVVKISKAGNLIWNWTQNPSAGLDGLNDIAVDQNNNYIVVGFQNLVGDAALRAVMIDSKGNTLWNWTTNPAGGGMIDLRAAAVDLEGDYIIGGQDNSPGNRQWYAAKLSPPKKVLNNVVFENVSLFNSNSNSFVALPNASVNLSNFVFGIGASVGKIAYASLSNVNDSLFTNWNVILNNYFVSLNGSKAVSFNSPANVTLDVGSGVTYCNLNYFRAEGLPLTKAAIISIGNTFSPVYASCSEGRSIFTADSFSGYALGKKSGYSGGSSAVSDQAVSVVEQKTEEKETEVVVELPAVVAPENVEEETVETAQTNIDSAVGFNVVLSKIKSEIWEYGLLITIFISIAAIFLLIFVIISVKRRRKRK